MKTSNKEIELLENTFNNEKLDLSFFSIEFSDGSSYEYKVNSKKEKKN